MQLHGNAAG